MRTLIFTCLCFVFAQISFSQLDCVEGATTGFLGQDGIIELFPLDFLFEIDPNAEYLISFNGGLSKKSDTLDVGNIGTNNYIIRETNSGNTCSGVLILVQDLPSLACNDRVEINFDEFKQITIADINAKPESTLDELIFSLSLDSLPSLSPRDQDFEPVSIINLTEENVCETLDVILTMWTQDGEKNSCFTNVLVSDNLSFCTFSQTSGLKCIKDQIFYVDDDQDLTIIAANLSLDARSGESYVISVDNGPFLESIQFSLADIGVHNYTISNSDGSVDCSGIFEIRETCISEICPNRMSFENQVASKGNRICVSANGSTEIPLASIQTGITWNPNIIRFTGIFESGNLTGITVNESDAEEGILRFLWIIGFSEEPVVGEFGFEICYEVIGETGQASPISFGDLPGFRFEAASSSGFTFPMVLEQGQVCVDSCPDGSGNSCYSFDQGQCATDEFASSIDINGTAEDMASQMKSYLESKSLAVTEVKVIKNYHEATCEACGICPEPHRFFVKVPGTQTSLFEALDLLNAAFTDCEIFNQVTIAEEEIPIYINLSDVSKDETVIRFTINGEETTIYDNATYGIPISSLVSGSNEVSIENSTGSVLNGVSTLDIVMTLQYVLGFDTLLPYQMIAADVDKSGDVSLTNDVTKMSNLILGIENDIDGSNWFFIPETKAFDASFSGFGFTNNFSKYQFLDTDINPAVGINVDVYKFGDLNQNFALNRSNEEAMIRFDNINVLKDQEYDVEFTLSSEDIDRFVGAQAAIVFDDVNIQELTHTYGTALNYVVENNVVKFSFASLDEFEEIKFTIRMKSNTKNQLDKLLSMSNSFNTEFITSDLSVFNIEMAIHNTMTPTDEYSISKIEVYPNPANDFVNISIPNIAIGEALKIYNTQGQLEYSEIINKEEIKINTSVFNSKGLKVIYINGIQSQRFLIQ